MAQARRSHNTGVADRLNALAQALLGAPLSLNSDDVAQRTGISAELNAARWRTMGHAEVTSENKAFTRTDVETLKAVERLIQLGSVDEPTAEAFLRTVGQTLSRLAEWQVRVMLGNAFESGAESMTAQDLHALDEILRLGAKLHQNEWRRHLFSAATRLVLQDVSGSDSHAACAGFVDIVGYTSKTRSLTSAELAALIDRFESLVSDLVAEHGGRVVKTIGDEVFFMVDDPVEAAWLGVELAALHTHDGSFPRVRVGMAYGEVLNRLGDVLGSVVNLASRLTTVAPPGRVIIDTVMAEQVRGTLGLRLKKKRRINLKGFESTEAWSLKFSDDDGKPAVRRALEEMIEVAGENIITRLGTRDG